MDLILSILIRLIVFFSGFSKALSNIGIGSYEEWKPGKRMKLLLVGYNGARNTGADARVVAIVKQIKEVFGADKVEITVMTLSKKSLEGYFDEDVRLLEFSTIFLWGLYKACCTHHAAIICEGSTLKSTFANALTMFFCQASGIMARQGKPCIAYGSEVGAMEPFLEKFSAKICKETYFITRTEESQEALTKLGLNGHVGTDTAWIYEGAIPAEEARELLKQAGWDGKKPLLGMAVIDPFCWPVRASLKKWMKGKLAQILYNIGPGRKNGNRMNKLKNQYDHWYFYSDSPERRAAFRHYIDSIAEAVLNFQKDKEFFPVLIGMERMDLKACKALRKKLKQPCAIVTSNDCSADIMVGILKQLSLLVTSRYHAAVLSMESQVPIIAVSMDERLDSIFRELSFEDKYLFHVGDSDLSTNLYHTIIEADRNRQEISEHIYKERVHYQDRLWEMGRFLKTYIERNIYE